MVFDNKKTRKNKKVVSAWLVNEEIDHLKLLSLDTNDSVSFIIQTVIKDYIKTSISTKKILLEKLACNAMLEWEKSINKTTKDWINFISIVENNLITKKINQEHIDFIIDKIKEIKENEKESK